MKKRVFSALLCLVMVIGLLPGIALADQKAAPEAPAATQIPMTYTVYCKGHDVEEMALPFDAFEIGDVTEVKGEYVCPITIYTKAFAEAYSAKHGEHAALAEKVTFNMKWDGLKWRDPAMTELPMIEVACVPEDPAATQIPMTYIVSCEKHGAKQMNLIWDTFTIGDVAMVDGKFVCPVTIKTAPYAEEYSEENGKHEAIAETISFNMTWNGKEWKAPEMTEMPAINVECVAPEAPAMTAIPTQYIVSCEKHGGEPMNLIWDTFTIGDVAKEGDKFVCPVTIKTAPYAEAYSAKYGKHEAVAETITFNMTWNGKEWEAPATTQLPEIKLECVVPAAPAATAIPADYIVSCGKHGGEMTKLLPDTFTIGEVNEVDGKFVCPITIATEKYAEAYSTREHGKHEAIEKTITFNMTWNGKAWEAPATTQLPEIKLECVVPAAPAANELPARYFVSCEKTHGSAWMFEIPGTVKIGEVTQQPSGDYVCTITVSTADYAEVYSEKHEGHTAVVDSVSYTMAWNGRKWVAPAMTELPVIALECVVTEPEAPKAPAAPVATELPMGYMVKCNQGRLFHGARFIYQQPEGFTIGEVTKNEEGQYVCTITVDTEQYAKAYSNCWGIHKTHTAVNETISFQMTWDGEKWVAPAYTELPVINVACARTNSWFPVNFPWLKW